MLKLVPGLAVGTILLVFAVFALGVMGGLAAEPCAGQRVIVSYYGAESGKRTASGMAFDGTQLIAAHKTLPFGTRVRFTYHDRSIVVPIEDRGPYIKGRVFDLSRAAAARIGMIPAGVARVCAEKL